ncbi:MAG: AAA family ATPase [Legionellales bacterium]|nr:MAG: AAA family ATPase [Legionellales bacterium]
MVYLANMANYLLPVGISNFYELITYRNSKDDRYLFVDKTPFIEEVFDYSDKVAVITRPRRFGKTINLSMLQCFFAAEVNGKSTKGLFNGLSIAKNQDFMDQVQGKFPVISLSFKDVKQNSYDSAIEKIKEILSATYAENQYLLDSDKLLDVQKKYFNNILQKQAPLGELENSLQNLAKFIYLHTDKLPILLIDEYDTPIQQAYLHDYYDPFITFMRNFFGAALKSEPNVYFYKAVITGITRVAKESMFSGLNNLTVYSMLDDDHFANYFGFTETEVNQLFTKANIQQETKQIKDWYNGYNIAGQTIYNPWSIIKCISAKGKIAPYWINTSSNELVTQILITASPDIKTKFEVLLQDQSIAEMVDEHVVYKDLNLNRSALWGLLLVAGYLKVTKTVTNEYGENCHTLEIPNNEIRLFYSTTIKQWLSGNYGIGLYNDLLTSLITADIAGFQDKLQIILMETIGIRDVTKKSQESFFHGLVLGLIVGLKDRYQIQSNKQAGRGYYDLALYPKDPNAMGIMLEFKALTKEGGKDFDLNQALQLEAKKAFEQINAKEYLAEFQQRKINNVLSLGIAFSAKDLYIYSKPEKTNS